MMSVLRITPVVVVATVIAVSGARAGTMTFDALPGDSDPPLVVYVEDGITATGDRYLASFSVPQKAHLDDSGTPFARSITFTMAVRFTPVSFDIRSAGTHYCPTDPPEGPCSTPYDNVRVTGFRDNAEVFDDLFSAGEVGLLWTYYFPELDPIDSLSIRALRPDLDALGGFCGGPPCGHFDIDNVVLVPGPVTLSQLTLALIALGALRVWPRAHGREGCSSST